VSKTNTLRNIAIALLILAIGATATDAASTMWSQTPSDAARVERTSDPVEDYALREILARVPELRQKPAPFLRLEIPEPVELPRLIGLREQPADNDAPVVATSALPRPVLPVSAPAKP